MRKVIDTNYLQTEALFNYLNESKENIAIITEYTAIEAYKGDNSHTIYKSIETLSKFPQQVVVLKNTIDICGLNLKSSELPEVLIDYEQTINFKLFCDDLQEAKKNPIKYKDALDAHKIAANAQIARIEKDTPKLQRGLKEAEKTYNEVEIKDIRRKNYTERVYSRMFKNIFITAELLLQTHPNVKVRPDAELLRSHFLFKNALCFHVMLLRWISNGSQTSNKHSKTRNDIIDMNFVTFALYFDGILSDDQKLINIYEESKIALDLFNSDSIKF